MAITYFSCMNCHKLKSKVVQEREERSATNYRARGRFWMQNEFGTFPSSRWGSARDLSARTPILAAGVGPTPLHLWQNGPCREGEMRARQGNPEGVEDLGLEGSWPCRSRLCPARAEARSTPGGSSQGLCSRWSLKSQIFHNVPSHCRKAERACESTWYWALSKWKHWLSGKCLSELTAPGIIV